VKRIAFLLFCICCISCLADKWEEIDVKGSKKPEARYGHSVVTYNGQYYIACGTPDDSIGFSDVWRMNVTDSSQTFTQIYTPKDNDEFQGVRGHATLLFNNKLYVLFGYTNAYNNNTCIYSYNFTENKWTEEYDIMKTLCLDDDPFTTRDQFYARCNFAAASISNYIYIFGGEKAANGYSDEERAFLIEGDQIFGYFSYSSINGEWTFKKQALRQDAPSARYGHSMISIDRTLYLFGGRDNQTAFNTIWKYSESEKTWEEIDTKQSESDIPEARCFHTMHLHLNKEFWILGGKDIHGKTLNDVWKFDIVKEKWTKYDTVESPISFAKAGSVLQEGKEMKIYIWGGETDTRGMLSQDIIYKYTTTIEDKDKDKDKDKKKDSNTIKCGVLGIEFVILALLFQRMRRRQ